VNAKTGAIRVGLAASDSFTPVARLLVQQPDKVQHQYRLSESIERQRGAYVIPLGNDITWLDLRPVP
jgi:hypothetical protein